MNPVTRVADGAAPAVDARVLVVDDEPPLLRALATNLRARGYDVDLAASGEEALSLAARHRPTRSCSTWGCPASTASR